LISQIDQYDSPSSYLAALREIDMARLRELAQEPPGDPTRAVHTMVTVSSEVAGYKDLKVWEQSALPQTYYIPPNDSYDVFIRLASASPVIQWREGSLDIRHNATGQIVVVPPCRAVYFRTFGPGHNLHLSIAPGLLARAAGQDPKSVKIGLRSCFGERDEVIAGMGRTLLAYAKTPGFNARQFMESAGIALCARLLERFGMEKKSRRRTITPVQLERIDEFIKAHIDKPTSLQELAHVVNLSPQTFHRAFKAATGQPPLRYCQQIRMRQARDLVEGGTVSISDIAGAVGYSDLAHFSNTFRKHWGVAPTRLRYG
jgi:AraC-like DNA-binding protein